MTGRIHMNIEKNTDIIVYPDLLSKETHRSKAEEPPWRTARDRALGYLDAIGVTPFDALELSRQATGKARDIVESRKNGHPVSVTMQIMRQMLIERQIIDTTDHHLATGIRFLPSPVFPEWNRGNMIPQKLVTAPWNGIAGKTRRSKYLKWIALVLGLLILLIYTYMMR